MPKWTVRLVVAGLGLAMSSLPARAKVRVVAPTTQPPPGAAAPVASAPVASAHLLTLTKVAQASFSPDGAVLMTLSEDDHQVHFWNVQNGEEVNRFGVAVSYAVFSGSGNRVLTWGDEKLIRIFDARTGKALRRIGGVGEGLAAAAISNDGDRALTCAVGATSLKLWDAGTGGLVAELDGAASPVKLLALSPDGRQAFSATGPAAGAAAKPSLSLWDLQGRKVVQKIDLPSPALSCSFSTGGKLVLVQMANALKIYDVATAKEISAPPAADERFPPGQTTPDFKTGLWKALGSANVTDAVTGEVVRPLEGPIDGLPICHAFSADATRVILGTGKLSFFSRNPNAPGSVYVHDVKSGKRVAAFTGHAREVTQVGLSADASRAFSRDSDKTLFLWAVPK